MDTDGRLLFVRQYRHPFREMLLEIPAGVIEEGESGEAFPCCASWRRKRAKGQAERNFSASCIPLSASVRKKIQLFFATELTTGTQKLDADEFVEIEKYTLEEAIAMIHKGEIKDGKTIAALFCMAGKKKTHN